MKRTEKSSAVRKFASGKKEQLKTTNKAKLPQTLSFRCYIFKDYISVLHLFMKVCKPYPEMNKDGTRNRMEQTYTQVQISTQMAIRE